MKRRAICAALLLVLGQTLPLRAAQIVTNDVTRDGGRYHVRFDVRMAAAPDRLKRYLTDYANYASYFDLIQDSVVLTGTPDTSQRVRLRLRSCVLFFCRTVTVVKDITELADGEILARIEPALSDFQEATEHWRISLVDGETRLQYRAALVPDFFVPPLIGPWLLKRQIRAALISGAKKLEILAQN